MYKKLIAVAVVLGCAISTPFAFSQDEFLTPEEAMKNFEKAADLYDKKVGDTATTEEKFVEKNEENVAESDADKPVSKSFRMESSVDDNLVNLEEAPVALNVENKTLKAVMEEVVRQAGSYAGPWNIKWRLNEDNHFIINERVNLTAETNVGQFVEYLVDRVNNMTGVQLFVTVFNNSRIILISDTYY